MENKSVKNKQSCKTFNDKKIAIKHLVKAYLKHFVDDVSTFS